MRPGLQVSLGARGVRQPAETVGLPGRPRVGNPPVPTWVAPRQQGVNLLSVGKSSRALLPALVCSGPALQKLKPAGLQASPALGGDPARVYLLWGGLGGLGGAESGQGWR